MHSKIFEQSLNLLVTVAYYYYYEGMLQNDIARTLDISTPTVSRLLKKAREENIVNFVIPDNYLECLDLEKELKNKYDLQEVIIAPISNHKSAIHSPKMMVALEGARYIQRIIKEDDILGMAWGRTMHYLIHYLNPCQKVNTTFVTLNGSLAQLDQELDTKTLVSRIAMAFGGARYSLHGAGLYDSPEALEDVLQSGYNRVLIDFFDKITISVSGVGSLYPSLDSPLSTINYLSSEEMEELKNLGVYGDLMLRFFDKNGKECESSLRNRTLAIDLETYIKIPQKIIVASGAFKSETIKALIKGKLVDVLIIDQALAKEL